MRLIQRRANGAPNGLTGAGWRAWFAALAFVIGLVWLVSAR